MARLSQEEIDELKTIRFVIPESQRQLFVPSTPEQLLKTIHLCTLASQFSPKPKPPAFIGTQWKL